MAQKRERRPRQGAAADASCLERRQNSSTQARWARNAKELLEELGRPGARIRYTVDLVPLLGAVADNRFGGAALELAAAARRSAFGEGAKIAGCWCCTGDWTRKRALVAFVAVDFVDLRGGLLAGVCPACTFGGRIGELLIQALGRDFNVPRGDLRMVHQGGRA